MSERRAYFTGGQRRGPQPPRDLSAASIERRFRAAKRVLRRATPYGVDAWQQVGSHYSGEDLRVLGPSVRGRA